MRSSNIKIYLEKLRYSPLDIPHYRKKILKEEITIVKTPKEADIILSSYLKILKKYLHLTKKFLLWTHEPYHDITYTPIIRIKNKDIHIMNVYTGDVFTHNYRYFGFTQKLTPLTSENFPNFKNREKLITAFSTKYEPSYYENNKYSTLSKRYEIIKWGYKHNKLKIWGKGWGDRAEGNSRTSTNRGTIKGEILKDFDFNLAIENTEYKHYITEKIWESIVSGCLPIYWSNSTIYQDFPKQSFLDYREFQSPEELFNYIDNMSVIEYRERMNRCIKTFNTICDLNPCKFFKCPENPNLDRVDYSFHTYENFLKKVKKIGK